MSDSRPPGVDGLRYSTNLADFPVQRMGIAGDRVADTTSIASCPSTPLRLVRCTANKTTAFQVATSSDGGATWAYTTWNANFPTLLAQRVAISATDANNFVVLTSGHVPRVTLDNGATWQTVSGLPSSA